MLQCLPYYCRHLNWGWQCRLCVWTVKWNTGYYPGGRPQYLCASRHQRTGAGWSNFADVFANKLIRVHLSKSYKPFSMSSCSGTKYTCAHTCLEAAESLAKCILLLLQVASFVCKCSYSVPCSILRATYDLGPAMKGENLGPLRWLCHCGGGRRMCHWCKWDKAWLQQRPLLGTRQVCVGLWGAVQARLYAPACVSRSALCTKYKCLFCA